MFPNDAPAPIVSELELLAFKAFFDAENPAEKLREHLRGAIATKLVTLVRQSAPGRQRSLTARPSTQGDDPATKSWA